MTICNSKVSKYISLFFICFLFSVQAQNLVVTTKIYTEDNDCVSDLVKKSITLQMKIGDNYQKVGNITIDKCPFFYTTKKYNGEYKAIVEAEGFFAEEIVFEINNQTNDTLDIGTLSLVKNNSISLEELNVTGIKKEFIKIEADKTTYQVKDNDILSNGSVYESITKIPGVIVSPDGGITMNGKSVTIQIDGVTNNLSGQDLINFIQSLPANVLEKTEIVSTPGASFDANSSGGVINLITSSQGVRGFSGTINYNHGVNKYQKIQPSVSLAGSLNKTSFQLITGYSYWENETNTITDRTFNYFTPNRKFNLNQLNQGISRYFYIRPNVSIKFSDKLSLKANYNYSKGNNNYSILGDYSETTNVPDNLLVNHSLLNPKSENQNGVIQLSYEIDSLKRKIEVIGYYSNYTKNSFNTFAQNISGTNKYSIINQGLDLTNSYAEFKFYYSFRKGDLALNMGSKIQKVDANSLGQYKLNQGSADIFNHPEFDSNLDFDYSEENLALYAELKKKWNKFSLSTGLRWEQNKQENHSQKADFSIRNKYSKLYPSIHALYHVNSYIKFISSYTRKVSLPSYGSLDPNNTDYYDQYNSSTGNPLLQANIFNNYEAKLTFFDYGYLQANLTHAPNQNFLVYKTQENSISANSTFESYKDVRNFSLSMAFPLPYNILTQGMSAFSSSLNPDKLSYAYLFGSYNKYSAKDYEINKKPLWIVGAYSQILLPLDLKMTMQYQFVSKGTYNIYDLKKERQYLDFSISKKFLNNSLKATFNISDVFNTNAINADAAFPYLNVHYYNKRDSRVFWLKLSYSFGNYKSYKKDNFNIQTEDKEIETKRTID